MRLFMLISVLLAIALLWHFYTPMPVSQRPDAVERATRLHLDGL